MGARIRLVEGKDVSEPEAARLLNSVWTPPAIDYGAGYLAWQLGFGQAEEPAVEMRNEAGQLVGLAAVSSRGVCWKGVPERVGIVSFVAVDEAYRGQGWAKGIYRQLLEAVSGPVITFARPASAGEKLIEQMYPQAGFVLRPLALCAGYAALAGSGRREGEWLTRWDGEMPGPEAGVLDVLLSWPDATEAEHRRRDPRGARRVRVWREQDGAMAEATVVWQRVRQSDGEVRRGVALEDVFLRNESSSALRALVAAVCEQNPEMEILQAPNVSHLAAETLKGAQWRRTGVGFGAWLAIRPGTGQERFEGMRASNLAVV